MYQELITIISLFLILLIFTYLNMKINNDFHEKLKNALEAKQELSSKLFGIQRKRSDIIDKGIMELAKRITELEKKHKPRKKKN